ncbi:MAG: S41 family peptidase [Bacteroidota bacterium]
MLPSLSSNLYFRGMRLLPFILLSGLLSLNVAEHECPCLEDLNYTVELIAEQHPGYSYFSKREWGERFEEGLAQLRTELQDQCQLGQTDCIGYFNRLFELIPDKHLRAREQSREEARAANPRPLIATFNAVAEGTASIELSSFSSQHTEALDSFYTYVEAQLPDYSKIVIDLRSNGGGRKTNMEALAKLIRDNKSGISQVAILQTYRTGSAAEQFLFAARQGMGGRVRTFGQNSYGALAYGGTEPQVTPHLGIHFRLPTVVFRRFRPYERVGVEPDVQTQNGREVAAAMAWLAG